MHHNTLAIGYMGFDGILVLVILNKSALFSRSPYSVSFSCSYRESQRLYGTGTMDIDAVDVQVTRSTV